MSTPGTHRHLQHAVICSQLLAGQHFSYSMAPTATAFSKQELIAECDWMGSKAEADTQWKLGFLGNKQILPLT